MKNFTYYTSMFKRVFTDCAALLNSRVIGSALVLPFIFVIESFGQELYGGFTNGGGMQLGSIGHYDFPNGSMSVDYEFKTDFPGASPQGSVIEVDGKLYGLAGGGGETNRGVLFEWDIAQGTYTKKVDFGSIGLDNPYSTLSYVNGKVYGTTYTSIFEWDIATNTVTAKVRLDYAKGIDPRGAMVYVDGKFYGTASWGGLSIPSRGYGGVIFEWDPATNQYTVKHAFDWTNGARPYSTLCYYNGKFFGVTYQGGSMDRGVLFEWDPVTNVYSKKMDFTGPNGRYLMAGLVEFNGKLYGTSQYGGNNYSDTNWGYGILYEWDPATDVFTIKQDLATKIIYNSNASLTRVGDKLYGTGHTSIFEYDPIANVLVRKASMTKGFYPRGELTLVNGTDFYGSTSSGGASGLGTFFKWTPSTNVFQHLMDFNFVPEGYRPNPRLTDIGNGKLYGITTHGGPDNRPAIFEYDIASKTVTRKKELFQGSAPGVSLIHHRGRFYLTGYQMIYEWDHINNNLQQRVSFSNENGISAYANIVFHNGKFYGTTIAGGGTADQRTNFGVIFEWDPETNVFTKKHDFDNTNGRHPYGGLTLFNGKFYGTTAQGGANDMGVLYKWDPATNQYQKLMDFTEAARHPHGGLTPLNGKLYGSTNSGVNTWGSLFEFDPVSNTISKSVTFTNYQGGAYPSGSFTELNGRLYGLLSGGDYGHGLLFEWDPVANKFQKKADITSSTSVTSYTQLIVPGRKVAQNITFTAPEARTYGDSPFLLQASSSAGLPVQFASSNQNVARVSGNEVTIVGAGTTIIRAFQDGDDATYPAQAVEFTLTVARAKLTVTADDKEREYGLANPPLTFSYSGFVNGDDETKVPKPTIYAGANQSSPVGVYDINFYSYVNPVNYTFEFVKGKITITKAPLTARADNKTKIYGNGNPFFTITYTGFRNGDDQFDVTPPSATTTAGQFSDVGSYPISLANGQARNYEFTALENGTLTIIKATLDVSAQSKQKKYLEDNPPLTLSYSGFKGTDNVAQLDELPVATTTAVKESDAGVYDITVSGGEDNNYSFRFTKGQLTINKADQTITFAELAEKTIFDPPFTVTATASSGLPVSFATSDPNIVTIEGSTITIVGDGVVDIIASQAGNHNYNPAAAVTRALTVTGKQEQQITFNTLPSDLFVGETFSLAAVSSSGLDISYSVDDPSIAMIDGETVTLLKGGVTFITASQSGNDEFYPAEDVQQTLDVHSIWITDLQGVYCAGSSFTVSYDVAGTFDVSNSFTLELSSASGSFENPRVLAANYGNTPGYFTGEMPGDLEQSSSYRMRIISSAPHGVVETEQSITIDTAPIIVSFTGPLHPTPLNSAVSVSLNFSDLDLSESSIDWGDGTVTAGAISAGYVTASHVYTTTGVFTVSATIRDACGKEAEASYQYIVIYDPYGGFVTGGGWFNSPAGAYAYNAQATGKANFGFVAKYQKGSSVPVGNTDFQFHAGDIRFKSTSYEWLVVAGYKAMYKGVGDLNGSSGYGFLISAVDGQKNSTSSPDKFRIKIWDSSGSVVYDNQLGAGDDAEATTSLGGGSIVIHDGGKSSSGTARMALGEEAPMTETEEGPTVAFPNPFNDVVTVKFHSANEADVNIDLVDVTGQSLYGKTHAFNQEGLYRVDLGSRAFARKVYILKISQGRRVEFLKVVRE